MVFSKLISDCKYYLLSLIFYYIVEWFFDTPSHENYLLFSLILLFRGGGFPGGEGVLGQMGGISGKWRFLTFQMEQVLMHLITP